MPKKAVTHEEKRAWVWRHYRHSRTATEELAEKYFSGLRRAVARGDLSSIQLLRQQMKSQDPAVQELVALPYEHFLSRVCDRIVRDATEEGLFNLCPACGALARTPRARQCPQCYHDWH